MECCDSVSDDGASSPYMSHPPGFCSSTPSSLLHLPRNKASDQSLLSPFHKGEVGQNKGVEGEGPGERKIFGGGCEQGVNEEQVDKYAAGDFLEKGREMREESDKTEDDGNGEGDDDDDDDDEECDELEHQIGEIIYQADGSAYVLESPSQLPFGVIPASSRPPIISTCHFAFSQSSTLKSFDVFHLRHTSWCHLAGDAPALLTCQSKDGTLARTALSKAGQAPSGRAHPVLLCFFCHLSFDHVRAFRGHVLRQHNVTLNTEERHLLSLRHTRAILQPVGHGDHPLLSFLEPKTSGERAASSQLAAANPGHHAVGMPSQEERKDLQLSETGLPLQPSLPRAPLPTSALSPAKDPSTPGGEGTTWSRDDYIWKDGRSSRDTEERLSSELACSTDYRLSSIDSSGGQEHMTEVALSNQSIPNSPNSVTTATSFMNNTKSRTDSELECGTSFNCHDPAPLSPSAQTPPIVTTPKDLANQESAMETEPNDLSKKGCAMDKEPRSRVFDDDKPAVLYSDLPENLSSSRSPAVSPPLSQTNKSLPEDGQTDIGSRENLLAGDDVGFVIGQDGTQGSSYSFGGQVTMTHSRNSCKTLKCPKCNWHYKYQQTLEAHMKEKHPDSEEGQCPYCCSGQSHPRLARGETYTCGYKPFRCQVCQYSTTTKGNLSIHMQSDKHLNNMQNLQTQARPHAPPAQPSPLSHTHAPQATSPSPKLQGRASWRCEVCDYETNVARNLRIHMTSEKHTHNMLLLQQNLAHMQRQRRHSATELYRYCQPQSRLSEPGLVLQAGEAAKEPPQKLVQVDVPEVLFECTLCGHFSSDCLETLSQHLAKQRSLPDSSWRSTTGDAHHCRLCHYATPLRANFQLHCQTDKHLQRYQLAAHLQEASSHHGNQEEDEEWLLRCIATGVQVHLRCNACNYEANSLEKLKLHTVNPRHEASLRLYKYLQQFEGTVSAGGWLHCVLCNYSTQNSLRLVQHSNSLSHQRGEGLLRLQQIQKGFQDEEEELGAMFKIRNNPAQDNGDVNEMESPTEIIADQEDQTKHADTGGEKTEASFHEEKRPSEPYASPKRPISAPGETDDSLPPKRSRAQEDVSSEQSLSQVRQCPFCRFCHADLSRLRSHVMIQHAVQPTLRCPLCQDTLHSVTLLRTHLTHLHSVTADCTQKLINTVIASDVLPEKMFLPVQGSSSQQTKADSSYNGVKRLDGRDEGEQERMTCQPEISKNQKLPLEDAESTKENTAAFPCWQKGCNKVLTSSSALQMHINQFHSQRPQTPISDRHVYKYRCSQCSLAFKTAEKLQLHSQYHAIRAATMCCLCQRSFRTLQALRKHLETSHLELSEAQLQQLCGSLLMTEDLLGGEDQSLGEDQGSFEEDRVKEDEDSDTEEKLSPGDSYLSLVREDVEPNSKHFVMPQRKGPNVSTEKFLDPSRPFKCTVCKESFTQKNILLVHYNSVSHLHKVKRSVQDSSCLPESVSSSTDHKPFKCSICNVAYSQSSTLEIHMRSVLHQTKARAAKLDSSGASSASANPLLAKTVSLTESTSSSHTALKSMTAVKNISCASSTLDQPQLNHQQGTENLPNQNASHSSLSEEYKKKQTVDTVASTARKHKLLQQQLQQQQLVQAQAQIQQELQKKAALLQSHLFNPALLHHFPVTADALLPLQQQQQLLLPFLIPGGEFQINPELNLKGLGLNLSTAKPIVPEDPSETSPQGSLISSCKQPLNGDTTCAPNKLLSLAHEEDISVPQKDNRVTFDLQSNKGIDEQSNNKAKIKFHDSFSHDDIDGFKAQEDLEDEILSTGEIYTEMIPPRVAHDAPGNVSKALLENIGFELVMQFNENKQQYHRNQAEALPNEQTMPNTKEVDHSEFFGKLECESCGKLFSNALILKSHKEHIHRSIFPINSLEKFAKDYREQYDKLFPFTPVTPEVSPPPQSPASPSLPTPTEPPHQKAASCIPVSETMATPPTVSAPQVPLAPLPLPIDLPLFNSLMMPLQALTPQLPVHLPAVEAGLTADLAQLQHQLTPALMQQGKRPRTRITDDQLRILRQYFDINNSPNEDQIHEMANKSGLPHKVIKHWFRNTLFKERQRNKDSPYNFNNPPITTLEEVKVDSRSSSPEPSRHECSSGRRSSRTRFTDFQLRVLQDFFDANAYPKDDEFEQLSDLLNLSTRVIVVWFQNARQKARKNYENQGEGAKDDRREFSNDRYIRSSNNNYKCKKCSVVFQRIFDLISHQKKVCYKDDDDDDDEAQFDQNELLIDPKPPTPSECSSPIPTPSTSSLSNCIEPNTDVNHAKKEQLAHINVSGSLTEDFKQKASCDPYQSLGNSNHEESDEVQNPHDEEKLQASTQTCSLSPLQQHSNVSLSQTSPVPSHNPQKNFNSLTSPQQPQLKPVQQMTPYQCIQCKLSFLSFEHWQEHQQMHFLVAQNPFVTSQFLDRPVDMPLMLFDPANPLLARQLLSGALPQIPANLPSVATIPDSTINSLKRKLEQKSGTSSLENDWDSNVDDPQRDKRMRTTITPEQLEILYQKYLLDSNPTRQMLDHISQEVGLKKRVVQVWFQNTRARERKGQFRALGPAQAHRRCPFCRALFKAQTALDAHIRSRHWHEAKSAGYSMTVSGMTQESCLQMLNQGDILACPNSPTGKSMDLSSHQQHLSPRPSKGGGMDDFGGPSVSSQQTFERLSKLDSHKSTSVNTVSNGVTADEEHFPLEGKHNSIDQLSFSSEREASSESEDKLSSGLVSPAMSFNAKDFESDLILDYSENSSLADPASPCPGGSNGQNIDCDRHGQKRYRTQLSSLQVKVLKACFSDYKTPTMLECEALGNDIGLAKRVVQVWFQNARAKEKKAKLSLAKQFGTESTCTERPKTECTLCCVKYSGCLSVRDHVFSQQHLAKVKEALGGQMDREYVDPASVRQLMSQQEADNLKKSSEVLAMVQPQPAEGSGVFNHTAPQYLNLPRAGSTSVSSFSSTKSDHSDPSSNGQISRPNASFSSSMSATIEKDAVSTTNSVLTPKNTESDLQLQVSKENNSENTNNPSEKLERASAGNASHSNSRISKDKQDSFTPAASTPKRGKEFTMEPAQLQALQGTTEQAAMLASPLLPCLMPGFPQMFPPQIPTALPGSFLQPMFGMESMFPYSPVLPQALMSLSPGSILQHYQHNLQGALMHHRLQLQQKQLLQQPQKAKTSQISALAHSQDLAHNKESVLDSNKPGKSSSSFSSGNTKMDSNFLITQCIVSKATCRERGKDVTLYDCLACPISLNGNDELLQHLESPQHRQRAAEQLNAKEHASRLLPHTSPSSTSQPNPPNNQTSPPVSQPKQSASESSSTIPCISRPTVCAPSTSPDHHTQIPSTSTALSGAAQPACPPVSPSLQLSLPSTVTSSLNGHAMSCHLKPTASGCCNKDGSAEEHEST